ncbi:MAG TPA: glycosyltransferase [Sphingobium sp.]|nr:glycosyltransferase [Sphingobium sp.]
MDLPGVALTAPFAPLALVAGGLILFGKVRYWRPGIIATMVAMILYYLRWRLMDTIPWGGSAWELAWPLTCFLVETAALFDAGILFAILARPTDRSAQADAGEARLRAQWAADAVPLPAVDVFIATYNEPREVLEKSILGCLALDWPDRRVWVLDDGRRRWVHDLCLAKGAGYITRPDNQGAKAGNINHALGLTDAPYIAVFDADFVPRRDFLLRTMGFFDEARIGIVQIPHNFYNHDPMQTNLGLQQSMPDDQRFFFEAIMPGRDGWDAAFCCGSNSVTRRAVFDGIGGGLPEGSITEDMLLTLASLRRGYVTRYLNEPLAHGLAPESTAAFFVQRQRWAQGAMQILYLRHGPLGPGLKLRHRFLFLPTAWLTQGLQSMFTLLTPVLFMLFDLSPMEHVDLSSLCHYLLPLIVALIGGITLLAPRRYYPMAARILGMFQAFRLLPVVLQTLVRPKGLLFKVTPKGANAAGGAWESKVLTAALMLIGISMAGLVINANPDYRIVAQEGLLPIVALWTMINILLLLFVAMMCLEKPRIRGEERFALKQPVTLLGEDGRMLTSARGDISISGVGLESEGDADFQVGDQVQVVLPDVGVVRGFVRRTGRRIGIEFDFQAEEPRDRLIVTLFTGRIDMNAQRPSSGAVAAAILRRLWLADLRAGVAVRPGPGSVSVEEKLVPASRLIPPGAGRLANRREEPGHTADVGSTMPALH